MNERIENLIQYLISYAREKQIEHKKAGYNPNHNKASEAEWFIFEKHLKNVVAPRYGVDIKE